MATKRKSGSGSFSGSPSLPAQGGAGALKKKFDKLLLKLKKFPFYQLFLKPVPIQDYPLYPRLIKHPTDISTIKTQISSGHIKTAQEVGAHLELMFQNALIFNSPPGEKNELWEAIYKLRNAFVREFQSEFGEPAPPAAFPPLGGDPLKWKLEKDFLFDSAGKELLSGVLEKMEHKFPEQMADFHHPVIPQSLDQDDYYDVIKYPMTLSIVLSKLQFEGGYRTTNEFFADMRQMFWNAETFWKEANPQLAKTSKGLARKFEKYFSEAIEKLSAIRAPLDACGITSTNASSVSVNISTGTPQPVDMDIEIDIGGDEKPKISNDIAPPSSVNIDIGTQSSKAGMIPKKKLKLKTLEAPQPQSNVPTSTPIEISKSSDSFDVDIDIDLNSSTNTPAIPIIPSTAGISADTSSSTSLKSRPPSPTKIKAEVDMSMDIDIDIEGSPRQPVMKAISTPANLPKISTSSNVMPTLAPASISRKKAISPNRPVASSTPAYTSASQPEASEKESVADVVSTEDPFASSIKSEGAAPEDSLPSGFTTEKALQVVDDLISHELSGPFREPVTEAIAPNYFSLINRPMDLGTIRKNIIEGKYSGTAAFVRDVRQIWKNCKTYNGVSPITELAEKLRQLSEKLYHKYGIFVKRSGKEAAVLDPALAKEAAMQKELELINMEQTPQNLAEKFIRILDKVRADSRSVDFAEPFDPALFGYEGYENFVKKRMDLATLRRQVDQLLYEKREEFERDLLLIFQNALSYPSTPISTKLHARAFLNECRLCLEEQFPTQEQIIRKYSELWVPVGIRAVRNIRSRDEGQVFAAPVDAFVHEIPDYFDVIEKPMDLTTVLRKLNICSYVSEEEMLNDIESIFSNCERYHSNRHSRALCELAVKARSSFQEIWAKVNQPETKTQILASAASILGANLRHKKSTKPSKTKSSSKSGKKRTSGSSVPVAAVAGTNVPGPPKAEGCLQIVRRLKRVDKEMWFVEPVDLATNPTYTQIVQHPMDLTTVERKLVDGRYHTVDAWLSDMRLIWENCRKFNAVGTIFRQKGDEMADLFEELVTIAKETPAAGGIGMSAAVSLGAPMQASGSGQSAPAAVQDTSVNSGSIQVPTGPVSTSTNTSGIVKTEQNESIEIDIGESDTKMKPPTPASTFVSVLEDSLAKINAKARAQKEKSEKQKKIKAEARALEPVAAIPSVSANDILSELISLKPGGASSSVRGSYEAPYEDNVGVMQATAVDPSQFAPFQAVLALPVAVPRSTPTYSSRLPLQNIERTLVMKMLGVLEAQVARDEQSEEATTSSTANKATSKGSAHETKSDSQALSPESRKRLLEEWKKVKWSGKRRRTAVVHRGPWWDEGDDEEDAEGRSREKAAGWLSKVSRWWERQQLEQTGVQ